MPVLRIDGLDKLQNAMKKNLDMSDVKKTVKKNGIELQQKMQSKANFKGHYEYKNGNLIFKKPTGQTKKSIGLEITDGGLTAEVEPTTEYSPYLEYGTRFMGAQPFVNPAFEEQKTQFESDMKKLVE